MKDLKVKGIPEESHWSIKVEAASRKLTMKDFVLRATQYVIDNDIRLN